MYKTSVTLLLCFFAFFVKAQTIPTAQPFGKIDKADLEMKACEFEKGANAEILFHTGNVFSNVFDVSFEVHKRIKIFNDFGKRYANVRIVHSKNALTRLHAQTINLNNGAIEITKADGKQVFTEKIDNGVSATIISFPNVKPGSVIEFKYTLTGDVVNYPDWYFQSGLPTRYSQLTTLLSDFVDYKVLEAIRQPYVVNKEDGNGAQVRALANIPSIPNEPYMTTVEDNCQRILFQLLSVHPHGARSVTFSQSWPKVGEEVSKSNYLTGQLDLKLSGENILIAKAKTLKTDDQKIAYLFNEVKTLMKWSGYYNKYAFTTGITTAWDKKVGSSGEINLILCRLLKKAGIKAYPMVVSTRNNGRVAVGYPNAYQFNSTVAYVPVDSTKFYVLDAINKYNIYNQIPASLLNSIGLYIDKDHEKYDILFLENPDPVKQVVFITGDVTADGKIKGTAEIDNYGYNRVNAIEKYKQDGQEKFITYLSNDDNNLKISSIKFEDMEVDTLPLKQKVDFTLELTSSDNNYIYFSPNILTSIKSNPFLSTQRSTDIDFGYRDNYSIIGSYTIPKNYKVDALPKNINLMMPDKSIAFKRMVIEQNGSVIVRYTIDHKKSIYFKDEYPAFHEFCKKMYEMLNEQIVLKKN